MPSMDEIQNRVKGILFGLAAGDKIGGPLRMALQMAKSLVHCNGFDVDDISGKYLEWWRQEGFDTGPTSDMVFKRIISGQSFNIAARQVHEETNGYTAGCNPAHRAAPLAMCANLADEDLVNAAIADAGLTHYHALAGDVSAAVVSLCRALVRGYDWQEALEIARQGRLPQTSAALSDPPKKLLNAGGFAPDVLAAAVIFVGANSNLSTAIREAVDFAGPANYCPVLAGSIGGARWGASNVADNLTGHNKDLMPRVTETAEILASECKELK
jgi:ADP-ribosyl-[dinitrogen reductase] hydrolase